jgi:hypothetical protein
MSQEKRETYPQRLCRDDVWRLLLPAGPGLVDECCEFRLPPNFPGTQATRGPEGFLSVVQELEEAFEEIRYEPQEFLDEGDRPFVAVRT